jgi:hypothetical protein
MSESPKDSYIEIKKQDYILKYIEETNSRRKKDQRIEPTTAENHYKRVQELIDSVIDFANKNQMTNERENVINYSVAILKYANNRFVTLYLQRRETIAKQIARLIAEHGTNINPNDLENVINKPCAIKMEDASDVEELYEGLLEAANNLQGELRNATINEINQYFESSNLQIFTKPYFKCKTEYLHFLHSITNKDRVRILKWMERSYHVWLESIKKEYSLID